MESANHFADDGGTEQNDRGDLSIGVNTGEIDSVNFGKKRPGQGPSGPGRFVPHTHCVDDVNFRERPKGFRNFPGTGNPFCVRDRLWRWRYISGLGRGKTIRIWDRRTGCWESVKFDDENPNEEVQTKFEDFGQGNITSEGRPEFVNTLIVALLLVSDDIGQIGWNTGTLTQNYHGVDPATNPGVKEIGVNQGTHFRKLFIEQWENRNSQGLEVVLSGTSDSKGRSSEIGRSNRRNWRSNRVFPWVKVFVYIKELF